MHQQTCLKRQPFSRLFVNNLPLMGENSHVYKHICTTRCRIQWFVHCMTFQQRFFIWTGDFFAVCFLAQLSSCRSLSHLNFDFLMFRTRKNAEAQTWVTWYNPTGGLFNFHLDWWSFAVCPLAFLLSWRSLLPIFHLNMQNCHKFWRYK